MCKKIICTLISLFLLSSQVAINPDYGYCEQNGSDVTYVVSEDMWLKSVKKSLPDYYKQISTMSAEERHAEYVKSMEASKLTNNQNNLEPQRKYAASTIIEGHQISAEISTESTEKLEIAGESSDSNVKTYRISEEKWLQSVKRYMPDYYKELLKMSDEQRHAKYIEMVDKPGLVNNPKNIKNTVQATKTIKTSASVDLSNGNQVDASISSELGVKAESNIKTESNSGQTKFQSKNSIFSGESLKGETNVKVKTGDYDAKIGVGGEIRAGVGGESDIKVESGSKGFSAYQSHFASIGNSNDLTATADVNYKGKDLFELSLSPKLPGISAGASITTGLSLKTDDIGFDVGGKLLMGAEVSYHYSPEGYVSRLEDTTPGFDKLDSNTKLVLGAIEGLKTPIALAATISNPIAGVAYLTSSVISSDQNETSSKTKAETATSQASTLKYAGKSDSAAAAQTTEKPVSNVKTSTQTQTSQTVASETPRETKSSTSSSSTTSQYRAEAERRAAMKANPEKEPERYKRLVDDYEKALIRVNEK